jgi:hypothetical protein
MKVIVLFCLVLLTCKLTAQETDRQSCISKINAAYGDQFFESRADAESFVDLLMNRITIVKKTGVDPSLNKTTAEMGLIKNADPSDVHADAKDIESGAFNPLFFNLDFFSIDHVNVYRIAGTDYFLVIQSQNTRP